MFSIADWSTTKNKKIVDKLILIFKYIVILLLILKTQSIFTFLKNVDLHINLILVVILIILTIFRIYNKEIVIYKEKKELIMLVTYIIYILTYALITKCKDKSYIANYIIILPLLFINLANSLNVKKEIVNITKVFTKIVLIMTIISMFFYIFGSIFNIIKPTNKVTIEWGIERNIDSYILLHFNTQNINIGHINIYRNSSIFTEAPMFALVLSIALMFEVFINEEKRKKYIILLLLGLISTITLSAFVAIFITYLLWFIVNVKTIYKNKKVLILNIIVFIIILVGLVILLNIRSKSSSLNIRVDDYKASFKAFSEKMIFGHGYNNENEIKKYMSDFRWYNDGLSNSLSVILAEGGIYFSLLYIVPCIILLIYSIKKENKNVISLIICYIISISIFIYHTTPLMFLILSIMYAYIYNYIIKKNVEENKSTAEKKG